MFSYRLCDLKSLNKRRGSSEYDSKSREVTKSYKSKKEKRLGLGDISSGSDGENSDQDQEKSSEDEKFQGFKVRIFFILYFV